ncbi:MAG: oxamate carbamoyltransferase subunit AllG family protein [Solirubrobacteraceae bacterium]
MGEFSQEQPGTGTLHAVKEASGVDESVSVSPAGVVRVVVREDEFHDPVTLMEASEAARAVAGVTHVAVGMGEPLNVLIFGQRHGYEVGANGLGPNDLVIGMRAVDEAAAEEGLAVIEDWLAERGGGRQVMDVGPYVFVGGDGVTRHRWPETGAGGVLPEGLVSRAALIDRANDEAVGRMQEARPLVVGVARASEVIAGMGPRTFLHAGPPIEWADMSGPLRGAMIGAILLEGLAADPDDAVRRAQAGEFEFAPGHERGALGPMVGVISASMPVWIVENDPLGNRAYCNFSEGYGRVLRFGAYGPDVIDRLRWMADVAFPIIGAALERLPAPLDVRAISADAVQMGDEVHNRNRAGTSQVFRALAPALMEVDAPSEDVVAVARDIATNDYFYLNLSMASGKATADAASGIENSTIVTTIARNGTEVGVRMSGTGGAWFTAPSAEIQALFRPGYGRDDANRDLGDSTITETIGLGGFVMAGAPAIGHFAGLNAEEALRATLSMYQITWAESANYRIPALGYRGSPVGIDCRKVITTGILPIANTGIAHREPGVGVIGGGIVRIPERPFASALEALASAT